MKQLHMFVRQGAEGFIRDVDVPLLYGCVHFLDTPPVKMKVVVLSLLKLASTDCVHLGEGGKG